LLTFCVIGAGPTGVEMAGTLAEIARHTLSGEFRHIDPSSAQVLLLEGGNRVLQSMPEGLSHKALEQLQKLGVQVRLQAKVCAIDADGLEVEGPAPADHPDTASRYRIASACVVWAAGVAASPLGRQLEQSTGVVCDRAGRVQVAPDLSLPGYPEISVVGDLAAALSYPRGSQATLQQPDGAATPVPGVSPAAKQMGRCAAANILRRIAGQPTQAFSYADYGNLATIGRNAAVVDLGTPLGPLRFSGRLAWIFWLFAHVYFLIGFRNRLVVLLDWASAYVSFRRNARVVPHMAGRDEP
jgi:NADH dehydrogenase